MLRNEATKLLRETLDKYELNHWSVRLTMDITKPFVGLCSHKDQCIILNAHHVDTHPDPEIVNTIRHEVAHALVGPNHGHDEIWAAKAKEIGCDNTQPCMTYGLNPEAIDAIRSGATLEVSFEEEVIRKPTYKITRLQDKCEQCGKVAEEMFSFESVDNAGNDCKLITLKCGHIIKKIIPKATPYHEFITYAHRNNGCEHNWDKNKCLVCGAFKLFQFQVEGAQFLEKSLALNKGAALFDEMGLGKTVQPLAFLQYAPKAYPVLWVVKSGIKFQVFKEIIRWLGPQSIAQIISTSKDMVLPGFSHYIVSYDLLRRFDRGKILAVGIKTVILDECQQIKNPDSTRTQEVRRIVREVEHVIPLSGTPWKNRGSEFFTVLNMLDARRFPSYQGFLNQWVNYYWDGNKYKEGGIRNPDKFKTHIADIAIRRQRIEVMAELPLINRNMHFCELEQLEQKAYDDEVSEFVKFYNESVIGGEEDSIEVHQNMLARLARMRHITGLAKIPATVERVEEFMEDTEDRKIVIFVHHKDVGQLLFKELTDKELDAPIFVLNSQLSSEQRFELQEKFNATPRCIMIASTLASGEGLNLQTCDYCIMHERQWNPANEEQAEGRFIRIGQASTSVTGCYVTAAGTVDEHLANIVESKRAAFHAVMNKGEIPVWNESGLVKELAQAIVDSATKVKKITKYTKIG